MLLGTILALGVAVRLQGAGSADSDQAAGVVQAGNCIVKADACRVRIALLSALLGRVVIRLWS